MAVLNRWESKHPRNSAAPPAFGGNEPSAIDRSRHRQPRLGFAYQLNSLTVLRGGWAIYTVPALFDYAIFQPGYSQVTPVVASNDAGLTYQANLTNPWPGGVIQPAGNAQGVNTLVMP